MIGFAHGLGVGGTAGLAAGFGLTLGAATIDPPTLAVIADVYLHLPAQPRIMTLPPGQNNFRLSGVPGAITLPASRRHLRLRAFCRAIKLPRRLH